MRFTLVKEIINRFYSDNKPKIYFITVLSLIASLFEYFGLFLIFQFIVTVSNPNSEYAKMIVKFFNNVFGIDNFSIICLIIGISIALMYILKNIYMYVFTIINSNILQDLSVSIVLKITKNLLFAEFVKVNSIPNNIKQGILSKANIAIWSYLVRYINVTTNVAIVTLLLVFLFMKLPIPATISILFISILSFVEYKILKQKSNYQNKNFGPCFDALTKLTYKIINATKEIRLNNKSGYFLSCARKQYREMAILNKKAAINSVFHIHFTEISVMATFVVILFVLYFTTDFDNQTIITTFGLIIAVILRITPAVNRVQSAIYGINSNENIVADLINFDKQFEDNIKINETDEILPFEKEIVLKNISYKYPSCEFGLDNINLKIKKGDFIGIVGRSGCYKTTLSLIIAGLIKAREGSIEVDNEILNDDNFNKWCNNISILSQDFSILKDDIYDGLSDEIIEKLELTNFNHNPLKLSFGQKQRAALAQIMSQNKKVLILDEATSSLDVLSEDKINEILLSLKGKITIISIAHRLQILKHCDRIIYMEKGKIIDIDTFINLNDKYDEFRKMVELSNFRLT